MLPNDSRHSFFLSQTSEKHKAFEVHFSIIDPERPLRKLFDFYTCLLDLFSVNPVFRDFERSHVRLDCQYNALSLIFSFKPYTINFSILLTFYLF